MRIASAGQTNERKEMRYEKMDLSSFDGGNEHGTAIGAFAADPAPDTPEGTSGVPASGLPEAVTGREKWLAVRYLLQGGNA